MTFTNKELKIISEIRELYNVEDLTDEEVLEFYEEEVAWETEASEEQRIRMTNVFRSLTEEERQRVLKLLEKPL